MAPTVLETNLTDARILVVDDEDANIQLLRRVLEPEGYQGIVATTDPTEAVDLVKEEGADLVLLDLLMPEMDGYEVLEEIRRRVPSDTYLPVLVLTSDHTREAQRRALSGGARDFLTKPLSPSEVRLRVRNLLETRFLHRALKRHNEHLEERVQERTSELEQARLQILLRLAQAAEYRDDETGEHTRRVGRRSALIAKAMGLTSDEVETIRLVAPLHDVGKIGIPDSILLKADRLTAEEFEAMKDHTVIGSDLLDDPGVRLLERAAEIARSHHERWDGDGYPEGLAGGDIPLGGRIVAVADTYDALTNVRPYKEAWSVEEAVAEIEGSAGGQFDPDVVSAFQSLVEAPNEPVG